ncbi:helix-turn-helix domain-containing protein [Nostoc sp.]
MLESKKVSIDYCGGGRKPKLSIKEQIILTLVYLRHLTTFQLLGIQFGVSESTANNYLIIGCHYERIVTIQFN